MTTTFKLDQSNTGMIQLGKLTIPGCGRNERDDAPVVLCEIEGNNLTLYVYGDINSIEPTHEIPLNGALLAVKKAAVNG
jgi:hypothetical protein